MATPEINLLFVSTSARLKHLVERTGCVIARIISGLVAVALCGLFPENANGASIPEPATVFYGKIVGTGDTQPFLVTEGNLVWSVKRSDGSVLVLQSVLKSLNNGEYSYRLDIPHQLLGAGLLVSDRVVPLSELPEHVSHVAFAVNGRPATILAGSSAFDAAAAARAATYRLDLRVPLTAVDSDGDGIPDWWMKKYGLTSGSADPDGDGLSNAQEYALGKDPTKSDKVTTLVTREIEVYAGVFTQLALEVTGNAPPDTVQFAITQEPSGGALYIRNAAANSASRDLPLGQGSRFSLKDVNEGKVVFSQTNGHVRSTDLVVTLADSTSSGGLSKDSTVTLMTYAPPGTLSSLSDEKLIQLGQSPARIADISAIDDAKISAWAIAKAQHYVVAGTTEPQSQLDLAGMSARLEIDYQGTFVPQFGADRGYAILAAASVNNLQGGMEGDAFFILGDSSTIVGNGGGNRFVFYPGSAKSEILDFGPGKGDVIDLRKLLSGPSRNLDAYVRINRSGADSVLSINVNGNGSGYTDLVIQLRGVTTDISTLAEWVASGALLTGDLELPTPVMIVATQPNASENDFVSGEITLTRSGFLDSVLTVSLDISGDAQNGVDYSTVPNHVTFLAGEKNVRISVKPLADNVVEPTEAVRVKILPGAGYSPVSNSEAVVSIEDRAVLVKLEVLEPVASQSPQTSGLILLSREGIVDRSVLVRLDISGTALGKVDYVSVPKYINLAANETTMLIEIKTLPQATLGNGKSVKVSLVSDPSYVVKGASVAVALLSATDSFALWRAKNFSDSASALAQFAAEDSLNKGVPNLWRYAFGLDPSNPDRATVPRTYVRDGYLMLEVPLRPEAIDVDLVVKVSRDLVTWDSSAQSIERMANPDTAGVIYRVLPRLRDSPTAFLNFSLTLKP